jgi:hypothetical protein
VDGVGLTMAILRLLLHAAILAALKLFHDMLLCFVVQLELGMCCLSSPEKVSKLNPPWPGLIAGIAAAGV